MNKIIIGDTTMKRKSEEWCSECGNVFDTKFVKTHCPSCGKTVVSCNNCKRWRDNETGCEGCFRGHKFEERK